MATGVQAPGEEYLVTSYEPDGEYIDGVLWERDVGEHDHSLLQPALATLFGSHRKRWGIKVFPERCL